MQQTAASAPSPVAPSFAGMLADFAQPDKKFPPARDFDGLEDDVATLSYESALKAHARYRPADISPVTVAEVKAPPAPSAPPLSPAAEAAIATAVSEAGRKSASVTIRMSQAECDQLRDRATEAGLTVSAYLRSCAFEVETLRAQVKQTVAELRAASVPLPKEGKSDTAPVSGRRWWTRIWPRAKRPSAA